MKFHHFWRPWKNPSDAHAAADSSTFVPCCARRIIFFQARLFLQRRFSSFFVVFAQAVRSVFSQTDEATFHY